MFKLERGKFQRKMEKIRKQVTWISHWKNSFSFTWIIHVERSRPREQSCGCQTTSCLLAIFGRCDRRSQDSEQPWHSGWQIWHTRSRHHSWSAAKMCLQGVLHRHARERALFQKTIDIHTESIDDQKNKVHKITPSVRNEKRMKIRREIETTAAMTGWERDSHLQQLHERLNHESRPTKARLHRPPFWEFSFSFFLRCV